GGLQIAGVAWTERWMVWANKAERLCCRGDASELIAENAVGNAELVGVLGSTVVGITEDLGLGDHGAERGAQVEHDQVDVGALAILGCNGLQPGSYPARHEAFVESKLTGHVDHGHTGENSRDHFGAQLGRMGDAAGHDSLRRSAAAWRMCSSSASAAAISSAENELRRRPRSCPSLRGGRLMGAH